MARVKVGDWVYASFQGKRLMGFVYQERYDSSYVIELTEKDYERMKILVPPKDVTKFISIPTNEDIAAMIDLALDTKDEKWFRDLVALKDAIDVIKGKKVAS